MSGTDKYAEAWKWANDCANYVKTLPAYVTEITPDEVAVMCLRELFVTREEYEAKDGSVGEWMAQATALRIERDKLRAALKPFAERETVAETLGKETPLPWSGKSPAERLAMMKEAKERHDGEILAARQAQSEIKETKRLTYSAGFATVNGVKISSAEIDQLVKLRDQAEREEKHRGYPIP